MYAGSVEPFYLTSAHPPESYQKLMDKNEGKQDSLERRNMR